MKSNKKSYKTSLEQANKLAKSNNLSGALNIYTALAQLDSTNGEIFFEKAYVEFLLKKHDDAVQDLLHSIKLNYKKEKALFNIAMIFYLQNSYSLSIYYLKKSLDENPIDERSKQLLRDIEEEILEDSLLKVDY